MSPESIIYHHTGDKSPDPQFEKTNEYHKRQGFPLSSLNYYIGYHFFIGKDGTVKQARSISDNGAHTRNCGCKTDKTGYKKGQANLFAIGICLAGDFKKERPTEKQIASLSVLTHELQGHLEIADAKLFNHWDAKPTSCPGVDLVSEVLNILRIKRQLASAEKAVEKASEYRKKRLFRFISRAREFLINIFPQ